MRALVYEGPWTMTVRERPEPAVAGGLAVVRVLATGICGSDIHGYTGENGRRVAGQVMGHETVLQVLDLDEGAGSSIRPGDVVTVNPVLGCGSCDACRSGETQRCLTKRVIGVEPTIVAALAERMTVPLANLVALPPTFDPDLGALVEPLSVGFHAVRRGSVSPDSTVLVVGAGPIGQAVALAARRSGAERVVVSEPDAGRRALVAELGFTVCNPATEDLGDILRDALGQLPDVVIDSVGSSRSLQDALTVSSTLATVVLVGMEQPRLSVDAYRISTEERAVLGSFCYSVHDFRSTADWLVDSGDALLRLIDRRVSLDEAADAFRGLADGSLRASKVLVYPNGRAAGRDLPPAVQTGRSR